MKNRSAHRCYSEFYAWGYLMGRGFLDNDPKVPNLMHGRHDAYKIGQVSLSLLNTGRGGAR